MFLVDLLTKILFYGILLGHKHGGVTMTTLNAEQKVREAELNLEAAKDRLEQAKKDVDTRRQELLEATTVAWVLHVYCRKTNAHRCICGSAEVYVKPVSSREGLTRNVFVGPNLVSVTTSHPNTVQLVIDGVFVDGYQAFSSKDAAEAAGLLHVERMQCLGYCDDCPHC